MDKLHATVISQIRELDPEHVAIDSTAINAWANRNRSRAPESASVAHSRGQPSSV